MLGVKQIAKERIIKLFERAKEVYKKDQKLADRYVEIARKIAMKTQISIPSNLRKQFCKKCFKYLVPGLNCRARIKNKIIVYFCMNCKNYMRFPYKK